MKIFLLCLVAFLIFFTFWGKNQQTKFISSITKNFIQKIPRWLWITALIIVLLVGGIILLVNYFGDEEENKNDASTDRSSYSRQEQREMDRLKKENRKSRSVKKQPTELTLRCVDIGSRFTRVYPFPYNVNLRVGDEIVFLDRLEGIKTAAIGNGDKNPEYGVVYPGFSVKYPGGERKIILWGDDLNIKRVRVAIRKKS
jgi:hypothetical protein